MASERTAHLYWIKISAVMPKGQSTSLFHRSWVNAYFLMWELRKTKLRKLFYSILLTLSYVFVYEYASKENKSSC